MALVRQGLRERGRLRLPLQGDSMWPTIPPGTLVEMEIVAPEDVELGDIVVWQADSGLIAHRVVQRIRDKAATQFVTKGDNSSSPDQLLTAERVLGRISWGQGLNEAVFARDAVRYKVGVFFWVLRWHLRRAPDRFGRYLPDSLRLPLKQIRDKLGYRLSEGFQGFWLHR